jgi:predicted RNA binding protein YcfA (HicA-like mRNA interferase family)
MAKAAQILAALKRDGWVEGRRPRSGSSHVQLRKGGRQVTWAFHAGRDLGNTEMAQIAKQFGYTVDQLRKL